MGLTKEKFIADCQLMFNHICVLYDTELVRLIGVHEDEIDLYYHVRYSNGKELYASAVGWCYSLKGMLPDEKYERLDRSWSKGNNRPEPELLISGTPETPAEFHFPED
jgi:hypothetical protein